MNLSLWAIANMNLSLWAIANTINIQTSHVTLANELRSLFVVMSHLWMRHNLSLCESSTDNPHHSQRDRGRHYKERSWPIHKCAVTHSCAWHDSFITPLFASDSKHNPHHSQRNRGRLPRSLTHQEFVCAVTHSCAWHDSFMWVTRYIHSQRVRGMGWLRSVESIKFEVSLRNNVSLIGLFCRRDL